MSWAQKNTTLCSRLTGSNMPSFQPPRGSDLFVGYIFNGRGPFMSALVPGFLLTGNSRGGAVIPYVGGAHGPAAAAGANKPDVV